MRKFKAIMEEKSEEGAECQKTHESDLTQDKIDTGKYAESSNTIIVSIMEHAAQTTIGQINSWAPHTRDDGPDIQPDPDKATQTTKCPSTDPQIKNAQSRLQAARDAALQMATASSAAPNTIKGHVDEVRKNPTTT